MESFQDKFSRVLLCGETVLHRLGAKQFRLNQTIDILRTILSTRLSSNQSKTVEIEIESARILFNELFPNNTTAKAALLSDLCDQIIDIASLLNEDSEEDEKFYRSLIGKKRSSLLGLMMRSVVEDLHCEWSTKIRSAIAHEKLEKRKAIIRDLAVIYLWLLYFALSVLFYFVACGGPEGPKCFSLWKGIVSIIPFVGQLFSAVMAFVNWGFWEGLKLIGSFVGTGLLLGAIGGCIHDSCSVKKDNGKQED